MKNHLERDQSYVNAGMCCATEGNHEKFILPLPGYKPEAGSATLPCTVCCAWLQLVNEDSALAVCGVVSVGKKLLVYWAILVPASLGYKTTRTVCMETKISSKPAVTIYHFTRRHIPEASNFNTSNLPIRPISVSALSSPLPSLKDSHRHRFTAMGSLFCNSLYKSLTVLRLEFLLSTHFLSTVK